MTRRNISLSFDRYLLKKRQIFLYGEINSSLAKSVVQSLRVLSSKPTPIYLFICSEGGDVEPAIAILDEIIGIQNCGGTVATIAQGYAMSAAAILLAVGSPGWRYATPNSSIMAHSWSMSLPDDYAHQHKITLDFTEQESKRINSLVANACGMTTKKKKDKFFDDLEKTIWLSVDEAIKFGLVDEIWNWDFNKKQENEE